MLPCCIECPFHAIPAVHLEDRIVLVGTIQAQIFGHHGRGDPAKLRGEIIGYRFPAAMSHCGEKGAREKGIDGRHAEPDSLGLGNPPGITPLLKASGFTASYRNALA